MAYGKMQSNSADKQKVFANGEWCGFTAVVALAAALVKRRYFALDVEKNSNRFSLTVQRVASLSISDNGKFPE